MDTPSPARLEAAFPSSAEAALAVLPGPVRDWFVQRFGQPTAAQRSAWPALAAGRNLLLSAPTGSGKTLAAFLPLLAGLLEGPLAASLRVLYVAPLKALAADIRRNLRTSLAGISSFFSGGLRPPLARLPRIALRTGDTSAHDRRRLWQEP